MRTVSATHRRNPTLEYSSQSNICIEKQKNCLWLLSIFFFNNNYQLDCLEERLGILSSIVGDWKRDRPRFIADTVNSNRWRLFFVSSHCLQQRSVSNWETRNVFLKYDFCVFGTEICLYFLADLVIIIFLIFLIF